MNSTAASCDSFDGDGQPLTDQEGNALGFVGHLEVGRPPGHPKGAPLPFHVYATNFPSLPLQPGGTYSWVFEVDGETADDWMRTIYIRPGERVVPGGVEV